MPAKNVLKPYIPGGYYHLYNCGVNKQNIFQNDEDYQAFLTYLQEALKNAYQGKITLLAFCLMPNHFHLLLKQQNGKDMAAFMQSTMTRYTMYFNKKHKRMGTLFQGPYRAVIVDEDIQLVYLTRYLHRHPLALWSPQDGRSWGEALRAQPSSYPNYLGEKQEDWVHPEEILPHFPQTGVNSYLEFIEYDLKDQDERMEAELAQKTLE